MFNISEAGAAAYDWLVGQIQGFDTTDPVEGGTNGVDNIPLTALAHRTRNLHDRLASLEILLQEDNDLTINNLRDVLNAFQGQIETVNLVGLLARKICNVTSPTEKASWVAALEVATRMYNLNTTEKATWVAGLDIAGVAQSEITVALANFYQGLYANEFPEIWNGFQILFQSPGSIYNSSFSGSSSTLMINPSAWRQAIGLEFGYISLARCEVNWGDVGAAGAVWRTINYNHRIFGILALGPGTWATGVGTVTVPVHHTLYEVILFQTININKCMVFVSYSNNIVGNDHVILNANQPNNRVYILMREPSPGSRNEFGHIHIVGPVNDYQ